MTRLLLLLFPRAWRDSYGDEAAELLEASTKRRRDQLDLVRAAAILQLTRLHKDVSMRRTLGFTAALCTVAGTLATAWAATQTRDGLIEVPGHWWGGLALAPLLLGLGLGLIAVVAAGLGRWRRVA